VDETFAAPVRLVDARSDISIDALLTYDINPYHCRALCRSVRRARVLDEEYVALRQSELALSGFAARPGGRSSGIDRRAAPDRPRVPELPRVRSCAEAHPT